MKKKKLNRHATNRLYERVGNHIDPNRIMHLIQHNSIKFNIVQRCSTTRSLVYLKIDNIPLKIILNRKEKNPITILPFTELYETNWYYVVFNNNIFQVKIFPDCYQSTENPRLMTIFKVYNFTTNMFEKIKMKKLYFEPIFEIVWKDYLERKENETIKT